MPRIFRIQHSVYTTKKPARSPDIHRATGDVDKLRDTISVCIEPDVEFTGTLVGGGRAQSS